MYYAFYEKRDIFVMECKTIGIGFRYLCKIFYFLQQFLNFKYSNEKENNRTGYRLLWVLIFLFNLIFLS